MAVRKRKVEKLKAYVGTFSWDRDDKGTEPDNCKSTRLTCFAIASSVDEAVEGFYGLLEKHAKDKNIEPGCEIFLEDVSEILIDAPIATPLFSATTFGPQIHGGVFGVFGTKAVEHYEGQMAANETDESGQPKSYTPEPFAVVAADGSFFRPTSSD